MTKKIVPIEQVVQQAENPLSLFVNPDDVVEVNPNDLNDLLDDEEEDED
jgi:hypothetical protein